MPIPPQNIHGDRISVHTPTTQSRKNTRMGPNNMSTITDIRGKKDIWQYLQQHNNCEQVRNREKLYLITSQEKTELTNKRK